MTVREVVIVGSGPAGWTAAIYAARAGFAPLVIAGELETGGALMTTTEVENFPGWPEGIMGPEIMEKMQAQAERFGAEVEYVDATELHIDGNIKRIITSSDQEYQAKAVILALGSAYRKLGLPAEERLAARGVSWCATCDGFFFKDQEIAVVGGGDSALTEALFLARFASKVTLIHRRNEFRASKVLQDRVTADPRIEVAYNSVIIDMRGETKLEALILQDTQTKTTRELAVTGLFEAIGHDPRSQLVKDQLEIDEAGYIMVAEPSTCTNLAGVFACGDVVDHTYRQAITAAAMGCKAALDAQNYLETK